MEEHQNGMQKPLLQELPVIGDRASFLYLEHCKISREDGAVTAHDEDGTVHIPAATVSVLLLGPGTDVSHRAMELIGDTGITVIWVGEHGVRCYANGRPLTASSRLLEQQARLFSNTRTHLAVVRKMYEMRFPDEDVSGLTLQQLRGREGSRVRKLYREYAKKRNVRWEGRIYDITDYAGSDPVNQALSAGNVCLYGLAAAVIAALGLSPGLGFIHVGHTLSFAYDIADLYKAETSIPLAFELGAKPPPEIGREMRRRMRDVFAQTHLIERMVRDIKSLLQTDQADEPEPLYLWDDKKGSAEYGVSYGKETES